MIECRSFSCHLIISNIYDSVDESLQRNKCAETKIEYLYIYRIAADAYEAWSNDVLQQYY